MSFAYGAGLGAPRRYASPIEWAAYERKFDTWLDEHKLSRKIARGVTAFSQDFLETLYLAPTAVAHGSKDVAKVGRDVLRFYAAPLSFALRNRHRKDRLRGLDDDGEKKRRKLWYGLLGGAALFGVALYLLTRPGEVPPTIPPELKGYTVIATNVMTGQEVYNKTTDTIAGAKSAFLEFLKQKDLSEINATMSTINQSNLPLNVMVGAEAPGKIWTQTIQNTDFGNVWLNLSGHEPRQFAELDGLLRELDGSKLIDGFGGAKVSRGWFGSKNDLGYIAFNPEQYGFVADSTDKIFAVKSARPPIETRDFSGIAPYQGPQLLAPEQQLQVRFLKDGTPAPLAEILDSGIFVSDLNGPIGYGDILLTKPMQISEPLLVGGANPPQVVHNISNVKKVINFYGLIDSGNSSLNSFDIFQHARPQGDDVVLAAKNASHVALSEPEQFGGRIVTVIGIDEQTARAYITGVSPTPTGPSGGGGGGGAPPAPPPPPPSPTPSPTPSPPPSGVTGSQTMCAGGRLPNTAPVANVTC